MNTQKIKTLLQQVKREKSSEKKTTTNNTNFRKDFRNLIKEKL